MTTITQNQTIRPLAADNLLKRLWQEDKPSMITGVLMLVALMGSIIGIVVDPRIITGVPAWVKPSKFAISIAIYSFTFVWMLTFVQGYHRVKRVISWTTAIAFLIEYVAIALQVVRGTTSHFNFTTPFDAFVFQVMAISIVILWFAALVLAVLLLIQRLPDRALAWGLRLGIIGSLIGMAMAFAMTNPSGEQIEAIQNGENAGIIGAHSVGVDDGGPGIPYLGWSTEGGDLRVPHFIGLHAMQALPLLAMGLTLFGFSMAQRTGIVFSGSFAYIGITFLTFWQAQRGQSVIAPDAVTIAVFVAIVAVSVGGAAVSIRLGRASA